MTQTLADFSDLLLEALAVGKGIKKQKKGERDLEGMLGSLVFSSLSFLNFFFSSLAAFYSQQPGWSMSHPSTLLDQK